MTPLAWVAGEILPLTEATVALADPGFLLGDGVFETLRARRGKPFRWDLHGERLATGLAVVGINPGTRAVAERAVHELANRAGCGSKGDLYLRVQISRSETGEGVVTALARPLPDFPEHLYRAGVRLAIAAWHRDPADPLCGVKSLSYLPQVWARRAARAWGFDDALIFNLHERVCESAHGNVIARRGRRLYAPGPEEGALDGVTRRVLLAACDAPEYAVQSSLNRNELAAADEVLLTSTLAGVIPVHSVAGVAKTYAGPAGELARRFARGYTALLDAAG